jgi:protein-S-isoprenylcysteine O-methyltransferase Ste14
MADATTDAAAVRIPPPLVFLAAILVGVALGFVAPIPLGLSLGVRTALALVLIGAGLAFGFPAFARMRSTGQNPAPWTSTPEIIGGGAYRLSRNPMYVGMSLFQAGIGVAAANGWILLLVPVSMAVVHATAIRHEEAYLERKFGETYLAYRRSVRRWL